MAHIVGLPVSQNSTSESTFNSSSSADNDASNVHSGSRWDQDRKKRTNAAKKKQPTAGGEQPKPTDIPHPVFLQVRMIQGMRVSAPSLAKAAEVAIRMKRAVESSDALLKDLNVHFKYFLRAAFDELCDVEEVIEARGSGRGVEMTEALRMVETTMEGVEKYFHTVAERTYVWHARNEHLVIEELKGSKKCLREAVELVKSAPPPPPEEPAPTPSAADSNSRHRRRDSDDENRSALPPGEFAAYNIHTGEKTYYFQVSDTDSGTTIVTYQVVLGFSSPFESENHGDWCDPPTSDETGGTKAKIYGWNGPPSKDDSITPELRESWTNWLKRQSEEIGARLQARKTQNANYAGDKTIDNVIQLPDGSTANPIMC
ncbi:hypothetical protein AAF712_011960 [Marasmius tenuissimus]|uniref:Uncharacterized protein n=1 Tax=Marasmius tenuissimus TaxID=585030 RepID=A0ABR2ZJM4_9AGAR